MIRVYDEHRDGEYEYGGKSAYDYLGEVIEKLNPDHFDGLAHIRLTYDNGENAHNRFDAYDLTVLVQYESDGSNSLGVDDDWWEGQQIVDLLGWISLKDIKVPDNV